ncbi:hypothetical protein [uncultured Draconibacterium sp.]|uniref:hypothetical protein n=1 Tax=uncultured Draconibacterium sp. TaxID=1573823 RepID=UPI0029C653E2|nr:hypothetical protein [uncultured Draconibacterium sp.]
MEELRDKIIDSYKNGELLLTISNEFRKERNTLVEELSKLHNCRNIDIIDTFLVLTMEEKKFDFFSMRGIFEQCLPKLHAPVELTMKCVKHLVEEAGDDGAAQFILESYSEFCKVDIRRTKETIQIIDNFPETWCDFLVPSILAGATLNLSHFVKTGIKYTKHKNPHLRQRATFALGRFNYDEKKELVGDVFEALTFIVKNEKQDEVIANTLKPLLNLYFIDNDLEDKVVELFSIALAKQKQTIQYEASFIFAIQTTKIPTSLLEILINSLKFTDASLKGILRNIDQGIKNLIKANKADKAIPLLEHLMVNNPGHVSIESFERTSREIYRNQPLLNEVITKWFLSRNIFLCRATMDILRLNHENGIALSVDIKLFDVNDVETATYLARKAIGWLYTRPVSCVSLILSLLESMSSGSEEIQYLLFNPMLISYPGKLLDYFNNEKDESTKKVQNIIDTILKNWEIYLDGIKTSDVLPELKSSEYQKEIYSRNMSQEMSEFFKESEKNSFVYKYFSTQTLLYGCKSISYTEDSKKKAHRKEFPLQKIEHSMEFPRLEKLDPNGLDYNLRIFRIENLKT